MGFKVDTDIVLLDKTNGQLKAFVHYAYSIPATEKIEEISNKRGITLSNLRDWDKSPEARRRIENNECYYPGQSALEAEERGNIQTDTTTRLGALETLANIFSGRITANDKDPFPHQLSLQQFMASNYARVQRLLIADEVGLGKTIEVGLILRDYLLRNNDLSCLYLTRGGLRFDVKSKLGSVIGTGGLIDVITSFRSYGEAGAKGIQGIRIGSIEAARRYATNKDDLPNQSEIAPDIVIIDECHYCSAKEDNLQPENLKAGDATQAYTMAYQMIKGVYWPNSKPPQLVILMSATPFRSETQFLNLLKLLSHGTTYVSDAYHGDNTPEKLIEAITRTDSPITVVWRQQDQVKNWVGNRFFPNLRIIRPHQAVNEDEVIPLEPASALYVDLLTTIKETFQQYTKDNGQGFGGFAVRQLEQRLTSSSIAGACYIFRWCIQHAPWATQEQYKADNSQSTNKIRDLIRAISKSLAAFDEDGKANFSPIYFASDDFEFLPAHLQEGNIPQIAKYKTALRGAGNSFVAAPEQLQRLAELGLQLLRFSSPDQPGVENTKLNWLKKMLGRHPKEKFLIFAESLQT